MTRWQGWLTSLSAAVVALVLAGPPLWGAVSATIQHRTDDVSSATDVGTLGQTIRKDTATALGTLDSRIQPFTTDAAGRLWTHVGASDVGVATDTEDGSVGAGGTGVTTSIRLPYVYNGLAFVRANPLPHRRLSLATNNATTVKSTRGVLIGLDVTNTNAAVRYLKLFDKATAPVCGTDAPTHTILVPGATAGAGHTPNLFAHPMPFALGLGYCMVTGVADSDNTAVAANELILNLSYQ